MNYRYCPLCATRLIAQPRGGRERMVCPACDFVQYRNPTVGVAVVVMHRNSAGQSEILLGRRIVTGSYGGQWCIPCGHVEWDEEVRAAAAREFAEETGLHVRIPAGQAGIVAVQSNTHNATQHTVGIWFYGTVTGGTLRAGDDLDRVGYFPLDNLPQPLAFPTDVLVLEQLKNSA